MTTNLIPAFIAETLVTDTRVFEVVGVTATTLRIRGTRHGEIVKRTNEGGNPYPCIWHAAVADERAETRTVRRRKDGTFRTGRGMNPLRPARMIEGVPVSYTDYRE